MRFILFLIVYFYIEYILNYICIIEILFYKCGKNYKIGLSCCD